MKSKLGLSFLCVCFLMLMTKSTEACGRGSIYLENNEYRQILIAIGESVQEDSTLIDRIKDVFTKASETLYKATRKRAFFKDITILIPKTWSDKPEYQAVGKETLEKSDVLVDKPDPRFDSEVKPFVIKTTPCEGLGHYMHLTPKYLLDSAAAEAYGPYGKVLVHEWAHLRWGVFDEYPLEDGAHFYAEDNGEIEATRCPLSLRGTMYNKDTGSSCAFKGNLPEPSCRFRDSNDLSSSGEYASLMYRTTLDHVVHFCEEESLEQDTKLKHNRRAPNQQNNLCDGMSVWEVMRRSIDFEERNPPREIEDTTPSFRLVRNKEKRTVLVLDVSGSMDTDDRIGKLGQGCNSYISSIVENGETLGMVWFNATGMPIKEMTLINNSTRQAMLQSIPRLAKGGTSIGGGIREGLRMLERDGGTTGATLIVISDGEENAPPMIKDVEDEVMASNVTIHTIAITNSADSKVDILAQATGGLSYLYSAKDNSNALNEAFQEIGDLNKNPLDRHYQILSVAELLSRNEVYEGSATLDPTLGRNTEFIFDYGGRGIRISLGDPKGKVYTTSSSECSHDASFGIYRFVFPGENELGKWTFNVTNTDTKNQRIAITVKAKTYVLGEYPIVAQAYWAKRNLQHVTSGKPNRQALYVSVSKGYVPVLNSDVEATIERPNGNSFTLKMKDNGAGADTTKNDGIYSSYVTKFNGNGRYNVKVKVNSNPTTVLSPRRIIGKGAPKLPTGAQYADDVPVDNFQREATGGSFELTSYVSGKVYPPGDIIDLRVTAVDYDASTVTLSWTASGDELDDGTASSYELRQSTNFDLMRNNFTSQTLLTQADIKSGGNLSQPKMSGEEETFVVQIPTKGAITYSFSVRSKDDSRAVYSSRSNVVSASMKYLPPTTNVGAIVGGVVGAVALIAIVTAIALFLLNANKKKSSLAVTPNSSGKAVNGKQNPVYDNKE